MEYIKKISAGLTSRLIMTFERLLTSLRPYVLTSLRPYVLTSLRPYVRFVVLLIFMIFGVFSPAGCSSKDKTAPGGSQTPGGDKTPDVTCPDGTARLAGASKKTIDTCMLDTDGDGIPDPPDLACPMGTARFPDASKKTTDTCTIDTKIDTDGDSTPDFIDVDDDGDGLIEINSLLMLHNIRHNRMGTSYKTSDDAASDAGDKTGCGKTGSVVCNGYELIRNLNFDKDGDGKTWSGDSTNGYTLDSDDSVFPYFVVADGGWEPIGEAIIDNNAINCNNLCFNAIFEGNGHTITGLAISRNRSFIGMFGFIDTNAEIRNIGLIKNLANGTRASDNNYIGSLVGFQNDGSIIIASYATGAANGGDARDHVGGLVGFQNGGSIIASYATGAVNGGARGDSVGGLVGNQNGGSVTASYATGAVNGGAGGDNVGGLVGRRSGSIIASYARGAVNGGAGNDDVGSLVGQQIGGSITASYGFGAVSGTASSVAIGGVSISSAMALTEGNTPDSWNTDWWDFGTTDQIPALQYADYDGTGNKYYCTNAMRPTTGTPIPIPNCGTLIPGQR